MADTWVSPDAFSFMPPALNDAFALLNAGIREKELNAIQAGVIADFRLATAAGSDPVGSLDASTVPQSCERHVLAICWYTLAGEIGVGQTDLRPAWQNAELYLRQIMRDLASGVSASAVSGASGTPYYSGCPSAAFPAAAPASYSPGSDGRDAGGYGGVSISGSRSVSSTMV